jgi:hypothetical protein
MVNGGLCKDGMGWRRKTLCSVGASAMGDGKGRMRTESVGKMVFGSCMIWFAPVESLRSID